MSEAARRSRRRARFAAAFGRGDRRAVLIFGGLGLLGAVAAFVIDPVGRPWAGAALAIALAAAAGIDARRRVLPDVLTLGLVAAGLAVYASPGGTAFWDRVWGAGAGYAAFVAIELSYRLVRGRDGLGRGDAKLFAAAGAWLGWLNLPLVACLAALAGLGEVLIGRALARRHSLRGRLAFGPHLAAALWIVWMAGAGG